MPISEDEFEERSSTGHITSTMSKAELRKVKFYLLKIYMYTLWVSNLITDS